MKAQVLSWCKQTHPWLACSRKMVSLCPLRCVPRMLRDHTARSRVRRTPVSGSMASETQTIAAAQSPDNVLVAELLEEDHLGLQGQVVAPEGRRRVVPGDAHLLHRKILPCRVATNQHAPTLSNEDCERTVLRLGNPGVQLRGAREAETVDQTLLVTETNRTPRVRGKRDAEAALHTRPTCHKV
jgi:hypothetical protein